MLIGIVGHAGSGKDTVADMIVEATRGKKLALADPMKEFVQRVFGFSKKQLWGPSEYRNRPDYRFSYTQWFGLWRAPLVLWRHQSVKAELRDIATFEWVVELLAATRARKLKLAWDSLIAWGDATLEDALETGYITPRKVLQTLGTEWGRDFHEDVWVEACIRRAHDAAVSTCVVTDCRFLNEVRAIRNAGGRILGVDRPGAEKLTAGVAGHRSEQDQDSAEMRELLHTTIINNGTLKDLRNAVATVLADGPNHGETHLRCG